MDEDAKKFFEELTGEVVADRKRPKKTVAKKAAVEPDDLVESAIEGQLTIDVYQTSEAIIIESPIAGVSTEDLDISITPEAVTIVGAREREVEIAEGDYIYQECYWGRFSRSVILPEEIDAENAEAAVKNGVLRITLPKIKAKKQSKKLKVKTS